MPRRQEDYYSTTPPVPPAHASWLLWPHAVRAFLPHAVEMSPVGSEEGWKDARRVVPNRSCFPSQGPGRCSFGLGGKVLSSCCFCWQLLVGGGVDGVLTHG